jgi:aspartyl protease family protein
MTGFLTAFGRIGELILLVSSGDVSVAVAPVQKPPVTATSSCGPTGFVAMLPNLLAPDGPTPRQASQASLPVRDEPKSASQELLRGADGLFHLTATINGASVRFLVDTGASTIVLTKADAARVGVLPPQSAFNQSAETAGGQTSMARVTLAHMEAGPSVGMNVSAAIAGDGLGVSLLGQSWLSQLHSVMIEGDRMVLR